MHQPKVTHIDILGMSKVRMDCAQQWVGALWQIPWIIQVHVHSHPFSFSTCREPAAQEMFPLLPVQTMLSSVSAYHICKWQSTSCSPCIKIYCAQWPLSLSARKNMSPFDTIYNHTVILHQPGFPYKTFKKKHYMMVRHFCKCTQQGDHKNFSNSPEEFLLVKLNRLPRDEQQTCWKLPPRHCGFVVIRDIYIGPPYQVMNFIKYA